MTPRRTLLATLGSPGPWPRAGWRDERGFSMAEMLAVVLLMAVVVALTLPRWQAITEGRRIDTAQSTMRADLRATQTRARAERQIMRVVIVAGTADYRIVRGTGSGTTVQIVDFPAGVTATDNHDIQFDEFGRVSGCTAMAPACFRVSVRGGSGAFKTVRVTTDDQIEFE